MCRIHSWHLIPCCLLILLGGCNIKETQTDGGGALEDEIISVEVDLSSNNSVVEPIKEKKYLPKMEESIVTDEMMDLAIKSKGNLARITDVMNRAAQGDPITIGVIGGSITQGSSSTKPENSYASLVKDWWEAAFPTADVSFVNAGLGGTDSYLGVHRMDIDLMQYNPDLVIVEFSVNDTDTLFYKKSYENLVRNILSAENNPAIILLFTTMEDGTSAQVQHSFIGFHYTLPMISYRDAILGAIDQGLYKWSEISPDNIHPNDQGHKIIGEILWNYFNDIYSKLEYINEQVEPLKKAALTREAYKNATIWDSEDLEPLQMGAFEKSSTYERFGHSWTSQGGEESIILEVEAMNIGVLYYRTIDGLSGQYEVFVDGEYIMTLDADFSGGWGNCVSAMEIYSSKEIKTHTVEIKKSAESTGDVFTLLGLLIAQ